LIAAMQPRDAVTTALLSLEGLPGPSAEEQRPYVASLEANLYPAIDQLRDTLVLDNPTMSPDKRRLAAINRDFSVSVYAVETGAQLFTLKGHQAPINWVAFSDNGKLIATASDDKTARLWNAETGETIAVLSLHAARVTFLAFGDDDRALMTVSDDGTIRRWNTADHAPVAVFAGHERGVQHYWSNFQKHILASVSKGEVVRLWDIDTGRELSRPDSEDPAVLAARKITGTQISLNDDASRLLITRAGPSNTVILWDVQARRSIASFNRTFPNSNVFVDQHRLIEILRSDLMFDVQAGIRFVDARTGRVIFNQGGFPEARFKGDRFLISNTNFTVPAHLWDAETFTQIAELPAPAREMALADFIMDGQQIATAPNDDTIKIWSAKTGELVRSIAIPYAAIWMLPDATHVVVGLKQGGAQVWDLRTGEKLVDLDARKDTLSDDTTQLPVSLIISADGKRAAGRLGQLRIVRLWDIESGRILLDAEATQDINAFRLNRDGTKLLVKGTTATEIWALPNLNLAATINYAGAMDFSEGGGAVIAKGDNPAQPAQRQPTRVWRIATDTGIYSRESLTGSVKYGVLAPQRPQSLAVVGSSDDAGRLGLAAQVPTAESKALEIIDVGSGRILRILSGADLTPVAVSADGRRLLVQEMMVGRQVWDAVTGTRLMEIKNPPFDSNAPLDLSITMPDGEAFNDSGQRLFIIVQKGNELQASIFDVDSGAKIASASTKLDGLPRGAILTSPAVSFSTDGSRITVVLNSGTSDWARMLVFDGQTAALKRDLGSTTANEALFSSPRKTWLLLLSQDADDQRARLLNSDTGLATNLQLPARTNRAWFSPDERRLITTSGGTASIWDVATATPLKSCSIGNNSDLLTSGAFSPNGASIALGTRAGAVYICDIGTGNVRKLPAASQSKRAEVTALAFSADGHWLAASGTGTQVFRTRVDEDPVLVASSPDAGRQLTFAADNRYLVIGQSAGAFEGATIHRLFAATPELVEFARSRLPRCLTPVERRQYHLTIEPPLWCVEMAKWPYNTAEWGKWLDARKAGEPATMPVDPRFSEEH
jgi:WD40 repeat protein